MRPSTASIDSLLPLLYRAAMDPTSWGAFLESLCRGFAAGAAAVFATGPQNEVLLFAHHGLPEEAQQRFLADFLLPTGQRPTSVGPDDLAYPHRAQVTLAGTAVYALGCITLLRSSNEPAFGSGEDRPLQRLGPHLATALDLRQQFLKVEQESALIQHLSHGFDLAYMLLNTHGRPLLMSEAARTTVQRGDGLRLEHGAVAIERSSEHARLQRLLAAACASGDRHTPTDDAMNVRRSAAQPLHLVLRPLTAGGGTPCALLILRDPEALSAPRAGVLRQIYQLLPSEIRLAESLVAGLNVKQSAARMHITENSARTMLKSVFRKTGVNSQSGLLRAVLSLPADGRNNS